ncbi:Rab geranylgeranyltransferase [Recurvomyces mirabilis]|nr:Rab geranylgeranyltransferase [Recurvomyces mirabilis]
MASHGIPRVSGGTSDKSEQAREKEQKQIERYKALEKSVVERVRSKDYSNDTFQATSLLLTQNPEYYSIWNYRRLLLQDVFAREQDREEQPETKDIEAAEKEGLSPPQREISLLIKEDLQFLVPLLKQYPKCYWIWNHRSWLLGTATRTLPSRHSVELWRGELGLVSKMLSLDSRNFHGWGYRREVVAEIERLSASSMVEKEFAYTTKMIQTNLSNFSAWHYRSQLIPRLLSERRADSEARRAFFDAEFELITKALYTDPYDQSLWFYHGYLMSTLNPANAQAPPILDPCTNAERLHYLEQEIENVKDMLDGAEDCKYIYQSLLEMSQRYLEVEAGNKAVTSQEMVAWLSELRKIDPLREGRWKDLEAKMKL